MTVMSPATTTLYPARQGARPMTAEDLWAIPRVGAPTVTSDGTTLAFAVTTYDMEKNEGRSRIYSCPARGGEPRALTSSEVSSGEPAFSPDGTRLAFVRKAEAGKEPGAGKSQIWILPLGGGEAQRVTRLPLGAFDPKWLPDGSGLVFVAPLIKGHLTPDATQTEIERREKDPVKAHVTEDRIYRYWDTWLTTGEVPHLFTLDIASGALRDLTPESITWLDFMDPRGQYDLAPDGSELAYAGILIDEKRSQMRSALFVVPFAGGAPQCLTPDRGTDELRPRYTADGKGIVYGQQLDPAFYADRVRLMKYDRAAKTHSGALTDWDLSPVHWECAGDGAIVFEAEDDARLCLFALEGGAAPKRIVRGGSSAGFSVARDRRIYSAHQTLVQPSEIFSCGPRGEEFQRLTRLTDPVTSQFATGEVREMHFEGAKGETVQMFVVMPPGYVEGQRAPLVHVIHGGPHGISPDAFHPRWNAQLFAAPGYVAAQVNFQGSTSWGQDFAQRIQGAWGERPMEDVMRATDVLIAAGLVDGARMAATGGSYGGYMASWIEGHTDRFKCIVNHAGVYNTLSQYASDVTQGRDRSFGGEPWDGLDKITEWNPAHAASGFNTPMLVLHGERDYRVPVTQGLECYGVLKAKGVPARLVYFPDENHWVLKPRNSLLWYSEVQAWLKRFLGA